MVDTFFSDYGIVIAFFVGLTGLGTFIWNSIKGYNKRQDEKEAERIKKEEAKDAKIKKEIEERAVVIKTDAEKTAVEVKKELERTATNIKEDVDNTAKLLKQHNQLLIDNVLQKIKEVDDKVMRMLNDLSTRADLTNGAVKSIRLEILQVNDDVNALWDMIETKSEAEKMTDTSSTKTRRRKRLQELRRRNKRNSIDEDSNTEHMEKARY